MKDKLKAVSWNGFMRGRVCQAERFNFKPARANSIRRKPRGSIMRAMLSRV
jgi:hypothetical protein